MSQSQQRNSVLVATVAGAFLTPFVVSSVNIALPALGRELHMNAVQLGWVATAYLLSAAMFLVPFGKIADIYGRKRVFFWGVVLSTAASVASALSISSSMLLFCRVLHGAGASMVFGTGVAMLTSVYPPSQRGKVLGINVSSTYLGLSLGPVLGGILTKYLGWRSVFFFNVPIGIVIAILILWKVKSEWAEASGESFDLKGSGMYGSGVVCLMYGFTRLPAATGIVLLCIGICGLLLFAWYESRISFPLLHTHLFSKNVVFALSNLAALINYSATYAVGFLLSLYLQYIRGFEPQKAGMVLIAQPVMMAMFSPFTGKLSDRFEARIVATVGMAVTVLGLLLFSTLGASTPTLQIISTLMLLGLGFAFFSSPNTNAVMGSVERRYYGIASATVGTMRLLGQMFSMGISMLIFATQIGNVKITPEYYPQFLSAVRIAFLIFSLLCGVGIVASFSRGKVRTN